MLARVPPLVNVRMSRVAARWLPVLAVLHFGVAVWVFSEEDMLYPAPLLDDDYTAPGLSASANSHLR